MVRERCSIVFQTRDQWERHSELFDEIPHVDPGAVSTKNDLGAAVEESNKMTIDEGAGSNLA
jgi:hypothetical protein